VRSRAFVDIGGAGVRGTRGVWWVCLLARGGPCPKTAHHAAHPHGHADASLRMSVRRALRPNSDGTRSNHGSNRTCQLRGSCFAHPPPLAVSLAGRDHAGAETQSSTHREPCPRYALARPLTTVESNYVHPALRRENFPPGRHDGEYKQHWQ
jgi:hypothetical protein